MRSTRPNTSGKRRKRGECGEMEEEDESSQVSRLSGLLVGRIGMGGDLMFDSK